MSREDELREALARRPRIPLAHLPTPFHPAPRLSEALGHEVWVKRDDLTGVAGGGNKARKLEYLAADASRRECDTLVAVGSAQSNHARTVAGVAGLLGLGAHLVLGGSRPPRPTGNLLLDVLFGAELEFAGTEAWSELEARAGQRAEELRLAGGRPYLMPIGGSTRVGALGFVAAYLELLDDCRRVGLEPAVVVHASSSGGTQAGLEAARAISGRAHPQVVGVAVAKVGTGLADQVGHLVEEVAEDLGMGLRTRPATVVMEGFAGPGYAIPSVGGMEAIRLMARAEGVVLDPVYSGKALHGAVHLIRDGRAEGPVVLWHTGGSPALFSDEQGLQRWDGWPAEGGATLFGEGGGERA